MQPMMLLVASLAVYRLSRMLSDEEGPFMVFTWLRGLAPTTTWLGRGLECILCWSVWVSLPVTVLITVLGYADIWIWPLTWLALSGVTVILRKWEQKR